MSTTDDQRDQVDAENVWEVLLANGERMAVEADTLVTAPDCVMLDFDGKAVFAAPWGRVEHIVKVEARVTLAPTAPE